MTQINESQHPDGFSEPPQETYQSIRWVYANPGKYNTWYMVQDGEQIPLPKQFSGKFIKARVATRVYKSKQNHKLQLMVQADSGAYYVVEGGVVTYFSRFAYHLLDQGLLKPGDDITIRVTQGGRESQVLLPTWTVNGVKMDKYAEAKQQIPAPVGYNPQNWVDKDEIDGE